jgi:hypothetical protein
MEIHTKTKTNNNNTTTRHSLKRDSTSSVKDKKVDDTSEANFIKRGSTVSDSLIKRGSSVSDTNSVSTHSITSQRTGLAPNRQMSRQLTPPVPKHEHGHIRSKTPSQVLLERGNSAVVSMSATYALLSRQSSSRISDSTSAVSSLLGGYIDEVLEHGNRNNQKLTQNIESALIDKTR